MTSGALNPIVANPAITAAEAAQTKVNSCLEAGRSFRLEAGAGAGKTYSLVAALKRLIAEKGEALIRTGQKVACITYTEAGRDEIAQEIEDHPAILVETIHAFSWGLLRQFQKSLRDIVNMMEDRRQKIEAGGGVESKLVDYDLGFFGVDDKRITLDHDDIPLFMAKLLKNTKFQRLLTQQFPVIFIDEYQDTDRDFMQAITDNFLSTGDGPLIGLFGDHWQTIYRSEYELADYPVEEIAKGSNFRSVAAIVNMLNNLRPELSQVVSDSKAKGEARFFHVNGYECERTDEAQSKGDVSADLARTIRENLMVRLESEGWNLAKTKVLMLTHNSLAKDLGYPSIAEIFKGRTAWFAKKEDPTIEFLIETLEPMCDAYLHSRYGEMFRLFGGQPGIVCHNDKISWREDMDELLRLRNESTIGSVIDHLRKTHRPQVPSRIVRKEEELAALGDNPIPEENKSLNRHSALRAVDYLELIELRKFVEGETMLATQHSVKGAEFENVLVVLGGGWNHYNWPLLFELLETKKLNNKNTKGYYRARNLFYVSVSRPMVRLAVLATQLLSDTALAAVTRLFGPDHVEMLDPASFPTSQS
ncbi:UvrD-helicase domain-containing protein [Prosthecobacter dejongeii]|uniref:DNA 3'-5' helicase II n=1 Tax=Prosthecobacter dejongeii TaxID=48465 RepID=A0A7W8DQI9_9BACT|nr:UvrD-helicase domain-containing protein [Prosthecobacter dejongeii]MBB5037986.1 DNA helicase-2/ATP-dependent DNA helicase PcrA [Prosthecobacter dejongeii]